MPSHQHQPARLTKKQKKATAFRERGHKPKGIRTLGEGKGKGKGEKYLSTGDNGEEDHDDDNGDEDANTVPAMEDQDQALAAMAGDTEEGAQGDGGRAVRSTKDAVGSTEARKKKSDKDRKRSRGRTEPGDGDGEAQPAAKKAKLARGSGKIPPPVAHEDEDEGAGMGVVKDGDGGHKSGKDKEHNTQRYILFIGTYLFCQFPSQPLSELIVRYALIEGNLKYTTTREAIQNHFSPCGAFPLSPSSNIFTDPQGLPPNQIKPRGAAHARRPTSDGAPPHAQNRACRRDNLQIQRLRIPRVLDPARAPGRAAPAPI